MSFSLKLWRKLLGPLTTTPVDTVNGLQATTVAQRGLYDNVTLTAPETTYASILDVSGRGHLLFLKIEKPVTTNSCRVYLQITLDGTVIVTDQDLFSNSTGASQEIIVGQVQHPDASTPIGGIPVFLPFNKSMKVEARYNTSPGASEDITAKVLAVYS